MVAKVFTRYSLGFFFVYFGALVLIFVIGTIVASLLGFDQFSPIYGALILASILTYRRFLKDQGRLPSTREYWSLITMSTTIVVVVDLALSALSIILMSDPTAQPNYGLDISALLITAGWPLLKGVIGSMLLYTKPFGGRALKQIEAKNQGQTAAH